ncbi:MAG: VWA domain-containing protein [Flavobacteriales bacterium]
MGFDLDEWSFSWAVKLRKKKRLAKEEKMAHKVALEEIKPRMILLARALTGRPIEVFPAEREGGYKDHNFFLPISFAELPTYEENLSYYLFRLMFLSTQQALDLNWTTEADNLDLSREMALEAAPHILARMKEDFPFAGAFHEKLKLHFESKATPKVPVDYTWIYGKWMHNAPGDPDAVRLENFDERTKGKEDTPPTTTLQTRAVEEVISLTVDKKQQEDFVMLHGFEKVETAEEVNDTWRDFDGKDELADHQDALEELSMRFTVRVDDPVHSVYQAEFVENTTVSDSAEIDEKGFHLKYDEWDYKLTGYKPAFCKVYPRFQLKADAGYYQRTITEHSRTLMDLRKMLTSVNNKLMQQRRQLSGEEFDIDAITDMYADVHAKRTPDERVHIANLKKEKDLSILLLLDVSLSSDGFAAGKRVIDVEKEVSILFGEILDEFNIDFSIDSFYSKTRNYATYQTIKDFDEPWRTARYKVGAMEPSGYTRIGVALRHAGARMDQRDAKNKWVILISDGKPNDYDKYEGKYGIQDVKQALRELNMRGINSYALAIEAQAKYYLPQMFGQSHYQILTTPTELLQSLVKLYEKIKYQ